MLRWLIRLFGGGSTRDAGATTPTPVNTGSEWQWSRSNEYDYDHYTDAVEDIKRLKRDQDHEEAINLLEWCIDFTEAEAEADGPIGDKPAPAYYRHLAIVLRKENRYEEEVAIIERYLSWFDEGENPDENLVKRLNRAKELAGEN